jgi:hypothetical protein
LLGKKNNIYICKNNFKRNRYVPSHFLCITEHDPFINALLTFIVITLYCTLVFFLSLSSYHPPATPHFLFKLKENNFFYTFTCPRPKRVVPNIYFDPQGTVLANKQWCATLYLVLLRAQHTGGTKTHWDYKHEHARSEGQGWMCSLLDRYNNVQPRPKLPPKSTRSH